MISDPEFKLVQILRAPYPSAGMIPLSLYVEHAGKAKLKSGGLLELQITIIKLCNSRAQHRGEQCMSAANTTCKNLLHGCILPSEPRAGYYRALYYPQLIIGVPV